MLKQINPNPGSKKAVALGCRCAIIDNYYGEGFMYGTERCFWISADCPLHGDASKRKPNYVQNPKERKKVKRASKKKSK